MAITTVDLPQHKLALAIDSRVGSKSGKHTCDLGRICEHLAQGLSLDKSSLDYETLCNYGATIKEVI